MTDPSAADEAWDALDALANVDHTRLKATSRTEGPQRARNGAHRAQWSPSRCQTCASGPLTFNYQLSIE